MNYNPEAIINELLGARKKLALTNMGAFNLGVVNYCRAKQAAAQTGEDYLAVAEAFRTKPDPESPENAAAYNEAFETCQRLAGAYEIDANKASGLQTLYFMMLRGEGRVEFDKYAFSGTIHAGRRDFAQRLGELMLPGSYIEYTDAAIQDFFDAAADALESESFGRELLGRAFDLKSAKNTGISEGPFLVAYRSGVEVCMKANERYPLPADAKKIEEVRELVESRITPRKKKKKH